MKKNFILSSVYPLSENTTITPQVLSSTVNKFWSEVFKPLSKNSHLILMCKVNYLDSGYKTLGDSRRVNIEDLNLFIDYLMDKVNILNDSYTVLPCSSIEFTYIIHKTKADDNRLLKQKIDYKPATHGFNNLKLPLSINPEDYGVLIGTMDLDADTKRYIVRNDSRVFSIEISQNGLVNKVRIEGPIDIIWTDTKLNENTFKREIGKSTIYVTEGRVVVKEKQLSAKPFQKVQVDKELVSDETFMVMDIESANIDNEFVPFLVCAYNPKNFIYSMSESIVNSQSEQHQLFRNFLIQLVMIKGLKYVYAHNLSGFDGIFLLRHLVKIQGAKTEPLLHNGKLICIKFTYTDGNKTKVITFKDSLLLLPLSLRDLCTAFKVRTPKSYFPFDLKTLSTSYVSETFPSRDLYPNISKSDYIALKREHGNKVWNFKDEAIKYCKTDCVALFEVLKIFNQYVFEAFELNPHKSLTLSSLAMRIFKANYMPKNTLFKILGKVEEDIKESYTGVPAGAVDVYIPTNAYSDNYGKTKYETLFNYDKNSLYPTGMVLFDMPTGKPIAFEGDIRKVDPNAYGFFYCKITTPDYLEHPILQRRIKTAPKKTS